MIWNQLNLDENHDSFDLKHKFNCYKNNFYSNHFTCKENFFSKLICVPSHTKKDAVVLNKIFEKHLRNILHENDENILFDANEFAKNNSDLNLTFVSADADFLKAIEELLPVLSINGYVDIMEFN